ncbi:MAG TPA: nucleoside hydrolase [Terriglobia bacterium]|nr:nucleoside hydrolase [Terriglobia bacterium]
MSKLKVIVDQDARGPGTSDMQAILVFLQSDRFEVLGITTVSGDQWVREETQHVLRLLEVGDRTDVPVFQGAEFPLLNSKEETERWEALYGHFQYKGCWTDYFPAGRTTIIEERYHPPEVIPPLIEGEPKIKAQPGTAAQFIVETVHRYPGEVVVWSGAPLTNIALALKLDASVAALARELVVMGGGFYSDKAGILAGDGRREFNWWFDPEAARIVLRAAWKKITITPIDISIKTHYTPDVHAAVIKPDTPLARYLAQYSLPGYMWDEIAGIALIEPSIITDQRQLFVDVEIDHGPSYGQTLFWQADAALPSYQRLANVQFDLDAKRFYEIYIDLMTQPPRRSS